jgi:CBS domain-containing protein/HSP20 family molecular chaperone IbpA
MATTVRSNAGRRTRRLSPLERIGRGIERMLGKEPESPSARRRAWLPGIHIVRKGGEITIRVESPEIDPKQIQVRSSGNVLTLSGASVTAARDLPYHAFKRSIVLPDPIDPTRISAECDDRFLTLKIRTTEPPAPPGAARKVSELMTREVRFVTPGTSIREAADLLRTLDIGSVPVCRDDEVVGILTDRDIAVRVTAMGLDPVETRVDDAMSRDVVWCHEDDDLLDIEQIMHDRQIRRLPVVGRGNRLVGYLTMARIARSESDLRSGHVLRGISQP